MMRISNTAAQLLAYWEMVKEVAERENKTLDEAAAESAILWEHIFPPLPRVEITPHWGGEPGETKTA